MYFPLSLSLSLIYIYIYIYIYNAISSQQQLCQFYYLEAAHGHLQSASSDSLTETA